MTEYVTMADALFFHQELIRRYGGSPGIRDAGALESALHRPQTGYYDTLIDEAAALLESLVQNHPFIDGNKRMAFMAIGLFLGSNGWELTAEPVEAIRAVQALAGGEIGESQFADWLKLRAKRR